MIDDPALANSKIEPHELRDTFGDYLPMSALELLHNSDLTVQQVREGLAALALETQARRGFEAADCSISSKWYNRQLIVRIEFPFDIEHWIDGTSGITVDMDKLARYETRDRERQRIDTVIYKAMEPIYSDAFKTLRDLDERIGTDMVDYGVAHAQWLREGRKGDRPTRRSRKQQ